MEEMNINANCTDIVGFSRHFHRMMVTFESLYEGDLYKIAHAVRKYIWDLSDSHDKTNKSRFIFANHFVATTEELTLKTWFQFNWFGRANSKRSHFMEIYRVGLMQHCFLEVFVSDSDSSSGDAAVLDRCKLPAREARDLLIDYASAFAGGLYVDPLGNRISYTSIIEQLCQLINMLSDVAEFSVSERNAEILVHMRPKTSMGALVRFNITNPLAWTSAAKW